MTSRKRRLYNSVGEGVGVALDVGRRLLRQRSAHQLIEAWETEGVGRLFCVDGRFMTHERDESIQHEGLVHPNALAHPAPRRALIVGGGDGGSARQLLRHPSIESVRIVELDGVVVDMARRLLGGVHRGALDDPRVDILIGDGFAHVQATAERYDLIVLDVSADLDEAAPLYGRAFYAACRARLEPGGLLSLHAASPQFRPERVRRVLAELACVFPVVRPYLLPVFLYGGQWAMVSAAVDVDAAAVPEDRLRQRLDERGLLDLDYYNAEVHRALFALPNSVRRLLPDAARQP